MKKLLQKIGAHLFSKKSCLVLLALLILISFPELAHAAAEDTKQTTEQAIASLFGIFMDFLNINSGLPSRRGDLMDTELILGRNGRTSLTIWVQVESGELCSFLVLLAGLV